MWDKAGNASNTGQGVYRLYNNGWNWKDGSKTLFGIAGLGGNAATFRNAFPSGAPTSSVTVKPGKWDYFFGRVKSSPHNEARSLQNLKDLETLGIKESAGGQAKLMKLFEEGKSLPEVARHTTEHGITITRTEPVLPNGAIDVKYFYPGGDLSATPEISTIIPKIFKK